jgi:hypothetical protein
MYDPEGIDYYQNYILATDSSVAEQYALARLLGNGAILNPEQASMAIRGMTVTQLRLTPEYQDAIKCFQTEVGSNFYGE